MAKNSSLETGSIYEKYKNKGSTVEEAKKMVENKETPKTAENIPFAVIHRDKIRQNPMNKDLGLPDVEKHKKNMESEGLTSAITVCPMGDGTYEILSGHQRFYAWCKLLDHETIPAFIVPYETDRVKRYLAHYHSNTQHRAIGFNFRIAELHLAQDIVRELHLADTQMAEMKMVSDMMGIGTSTYYDLVNVDKKAIPELKEFAYEGGRKIEANGKTYSIFLSVNTLTNATSLNEEQQRVVCEKLEKIARDRSRKAPLGEEENCEIEVTREEFKRIARDVKAEFDPEAAKKKKAEKRTYVDKMKKTYSGFFQTICKPKTEEERTETIKYIDTILNELKEYREKLVNPEIG